MSGTIIEGKPQLQPGVCFLCELSNPVQYWDTLRDFYGIVRESLDGRKYVCEECIKEGASLLGFVTPEEAEVIKAAHSGAVAELARLSEENAKLKQLKELSEFFTQNAPTEKPKASARKPAAAKA